MKKFFASFFLALVTVTPAMAHIDPGKPAHLNPHWLPFLFTALLTIALMVIGVILYKAKELEKEDEKQKDFDL